MPRFVMLEHDHPERHIDFMLEHEGMLRTWRLARMPERAGDVIPASALADHRVAYLDYEGPVSGNRGQVVRRAAGSFELLESRFGDEALELMLRTAQWECRASLRTTNGEWFLEVRSFDRRKPD